jgi:hypothetical protein
MHTSTTLQADRTAVDVAELLDEGDGILVSVRLDDELRTIRSIEPRADAKAGNLLNLASGLFVAGIALVGTGKLPLIALVVAAGALGLLGAAVVLLSRLHRAELGGNFGFPRWALAVSDDEILRALAAGPTVDSADEHAEQARQLRWLSGALDRKFRRLNTAQTLIVAALAVGAVAALLSAIGR